MTKHYFDIDHERDPEHDDGLPACEVRIHYTFHPFVPERGPTYASGGQPPEAEFLEFDRAQRQIGGKWTDAPEFNDWAGHWLDDDGYDIAMEQACADNEPPDDVRRSESAP
jgi:hypothetical protein